MLKVRALSQSDLRSVKLFTDREIGLNYYSESELAEIFDRSQADGIMCSLILENALGEIKGIRISYPPGHWDHGKGRGLKPELWPHSLIETAYFQSLFLAKDVQAEGWGGKLSRAAIQQLIEAKAKGIVCHAWKESPHNSSRRYLQKLGFKEITDHPLYWKDVNYNCTRCLKPPCQCTAVEMYLDLKGGS